MKRLAWILAMSMIVLAFSSSASGEGGGGDSMCPETTCSNNTECIEIVYCTSCERKPDGNKCKN
jgi:hypothetical protein